MIKFVYKRALFATYGPHRAKKHKDMLSILRPRSTSWKKSKLIRCVATRDALDRHVCDSAAARLRAHARTQTERQNVRVRQALACSTQHFNM